MHSVILRIVRNILWYKNLLRCFIAKFIYLQCVKKYDKPWTSELLFPINNLWYQSRVIFPIFPLPGAKELITSTYILSQKKRYAFKVVIIKWYSIFVFPLHSYRSKWSQRLNVYICKRMKYQYKTSICCDRYSFRHSWYIHTNVQCKKKNISSIIVKYRNIEVQDCTKRVNKLRKYLCQ